MPPRALDPISLVTTTPGRTRPGSAHDDVRQRPPGDDVAWQDWDLMFRAVLERLARIAVDQPVPEGADLRLAQPASALLECVEALDLLRRSLARRTS